MTGIPPGPGAVPAPGAARAADGAVVRGADVAVGLRSTSTILGFHFESIAAGAVAFEGTVPIAGKIILDALWWDIGVGAVETDPHRIQLAMATDTPGTQAAMDGEEQVFTQASSAVVSKSRLVTGSGGAGPLLVIGRELVLKGRRLVCGLFNGNAATTTDAYVGLVVHRVVGGQAGGDSGFLVGEEVRER